MSTLARPPGGGAGVPRLGVFYAGGTIGMEMRGGRLAPASGLAQTLAAQLDAHCGRVAHWRIAALPSPIDSADATPATWHAIARGVIALADEGCAGVLVLHGTDTLAHSAAALAFLLLDLPVPVVLTGSMRPASAIGTDAWRNVRGAVELLLAPGARGVQLYFGGRRLDALRSRKRATDRDDAFEECARPASPHPQARLAAPWHLRQAWLPVRTALLSLHPGFAPELLHALAASGVAGCVLACYGSGTGPTADPSFLAALDAAHAGGMVLVATSQCPEGTVSPGRYEAGARLLRAGVVDGGSMTPEAALAKLHVLLSAGLDADACRVWMTRALSTEFY